VTSVCLLTEGTYPYVTGGVSTWARGLVGGLPDISWSVVHLSDRPPTGLPRLPPQVNDLVDLQVRGGRGPVPGRRETARLARLLPGADVYHATAVGAASAIAAVAAKAAGTGAGGPAGFVLTEHGTAWREAELAGGPLETGRRAPTNPGSHRRWVGALQHEARRAYAAADAVTTVSSAGARWQRQFGARSPLVLPHPPSGTEGVSRHPDRPPLVALVGRVVPLKDIATFIHACALIGRSIPDCTFAVIGPLDADPAYAEHCRELIADEHLDDRLLLVGEDDVRRWYPRMAVAVSTSRSEARPFVLLEAMQHRVPVVATDVGDCAEMIGSADGPAAGLAVPPGDVPAVAAAVLQILGSPPLGRQLGMTGAARVAALPSPDEHADSYRHIYRQVLARRGGRR